MVTATFANETATRQTWTRPTLTPRDWLVPIPPRCLAELDAAVTARSSKPGPAERLARELPACAALMDRVRDALTQGVGLVVLDRVPVERYTLQENRTLGEILARMLGPVVAQKCDGTRIYDVKDSGQPLGHGVRRSVTNLGQPFHTDGGWLSLPPAFVGLFCLESAESGGLSRFVSLVTAHELLRAQHPDLVDRLYRPFWWDRQAEHAPGDTPVSTHPVFAQDGGGLVARYYEDYVVKGHALAGEALDAAGVAALATLRQIVDAPAHWVEFRIEQGQFQYLNNHRFAHSRTAFADLPGDRHRHMLRFWNREDGSEHLEGR